LEILSKSTIDKKNNNINTKVTTLLQLYPHWLQTVSKIWCSPFAWTATPHSKNLNILTSESLH